MTNRFVTDALRQGMAIVLIAVVLSLLVNHFRQGGLPLVGGPVRGLSSLKTAGGWGETVISIEEARALFLTDGAVFIDARPEELYRSGHIKGALNLPPETFEESLPVVMAQIPPDSFIITYCDGEDCHMSNDAALQLSAKGYSNVQVLVNGWSAWQNAGLPVEK